MAAADREPRVDDPQPAPRSGAAAFLVGLGILLSRVMGLVRERMLATYFGTSLHADVFSAGVSPATEVHPLALEVLRTRFSVDTADLFPKHLDRFRGDRFDYVITVCDRTAETCPTFPGDPERIHWSFDDPVKGNGEEAQRRAFELVANGLAARLRIWMAFPAVHLRLDAAEERNEVRS